MFHPAGQDVGIHQVPPPVVVAPPPLAAERFASAPPWRPPHPDDITYASLSNQTDMTVNRIRQEVTHTTFL